MELTKLANKYLADGIAEESTLNGPDSLEIYEQVQNKEYFISLLATIFWQSFVYSDTFLSYVKKVGLKSEDYASRLFDSEKPKEHPPLAGPNSLFVLGHQGKGSNYQRFDLLVFDNHIQECKTLNLRQEDVRPEELELGWIRFVRNVASNDRRLSELRHSSSLGIDSIDAIFFHGAKAALELCKAMPFGILFVSAPELVSTTGVASSPIKISLNPGSSTIATGGVIASNSRGQIGVTSALHAFSPASIPYEMRAPLAASLRDKRVFVDGQNGRIVSFDLQTDSCFIETPLSRSTGLIGTQGPLRGKVPRGGELVTFQGGPAEGDITSTVVTAWSLHLPFIVPTVRSLILTKPDTYPGSSGSALIDQNDNVLGFASLRSKYDEMAEFSVWVWAESVYLAHHLI